MSNSSELVSELDSSLLSNRMKNLQKLNLYPKKMGHNDKSRNESPIKVPHSASAAKVESEETDKYILALKKEKSENEANSAKRLDIKLPVSTKTRKQISLNSIEGRKFLLISSSLEKQLNITQTQLKRDKFMLLNQILETKAVNSNLENSENNKKDIFETSFGGSSFNMSHNIFSDRNLVSSFAERSFSERAHALFSQIPELSIKEYKNEIKLNEYGKPYKSYLDSITEKFVDQKRTCYPSYLKKSNNSSMTTNDVRKLVDRIKNINEMNRRTCSKYRNHLIKLNQAETYNQSKYLVKEFPEITDILNPLSENKAENQQDINEEELKTHSLSKVSLISKQVLKE